MTIILGEEATTVVEVVVVDMVVAVVMTEEVVEEVVEVEAHKVQRTGANRLLGGALKSLLFWDCCFVVLWRQILTF